MLPVTTAEIQCHVTHDVQTQPDRSSEMLDENTVFLLG